MILRIFELQNWGEEGATVFLVKLEARSSATRIGGRREEAGAIRG